jgi:hypothetical protein
MKTAVLAAGAALASLALALPASAAHLPRTYWSEAYAEQTLLDSAYAQDNALEDAQCVGRGRPVFATDGTADYLNFFCTLYYEDDYQGGLNDFTALLRVIGNPDRFTLSHISDPAFTTTGASGAGQTVVTPTSAAQAGSTGSGLSGASVPAPAQSQQNSLTPIGGDWVGVLPGTSTSLYYLGLNDQCVYATAAGTCFNQSYQATGTLQLSHP